VKRKATAQDYEKLGKAVANVFKSDYFNVIETKKRFIYMTFLRGVLMGLGSAVGATLILAILLWVLSLFGELPWVGNFFESTKESLNP
jgi:hypothetical protein